MSDFIIKVYNKINSLPWIGNTAIPIVSTALALLSFYLQFRVKISYKNKRKLAKALKHVFIPLMKKVYDWDLSNADEVVELYEDTRKLFIAEVMYVPDFLLRRINSIGTHISEYKIYNCEDSYKDAQRKRITREFVKLILYVKHYFNYIRRVLGYPNDSFYQTCCCTDRAPRFSFVIQISLIIVLCLPDVILILGKSTAATTALITLLLVLMLLILICIQIVYGIKKSGGIKYIFLKIWCTKFSRGNRKTPKHYGQSALTPRTRKGLNQ